MSDISDINSSLDNKLICINVDLLEYVHGQVYIVLLIYMYI